MVRSKSTPCKSLPVIDWNHPDVCFWFFGKVPSDGKKRHDFLKEKKKKLLEKNGEHKQDLQHPLATHPEIPALTDLQMYITEAILCSTKEESESVDFETINEYVSKRWRSIKRRDGSSYSTDCRRAIQANLRHNPNHIPLFRRDKNFPDHWTLCKSIEEAEHVYRERSARKKSKAEKETREARDAEYQKEETGNEQQEASDLEENHHMEDASMSEETKEEEGTEDFNEDIKKVHFEELIQECINDNSGSCHFEFILMHVTKNRHKLIEETQGKDLKNQVLQALLFSKNSFKRDSRRIGWWTLSNPDEGRETRSKTSKKEKEAGLPEKQTDLMEEESVSKSRDPPMTELQILIIQAVSMHGGTANFEQIYEHVAKSFENLRRRNGLPYTSDCRRAIQASLSNNPPTRPFFKVKRDQKKGLTTWTLAKRSIEFLEERKKQNESEPSKGSENEEGSSKKSNSDTNKSEGEEEIVDEELSIDEEDIKELEPDTKETEKLKSPSEEKCLYPNRLKRAKQLKEKARLEQQQQPDRISKRRRHVK